MRSASLAAFRNICFTATFGLACAGDSSQPADSAAPATAVAATDSGAIWTSPVERIEPAVIRAALVDSTRWQAYPEEVDRLCTGTAACNDGNARTKVRLWSDTGSIRVSYDDAGADAILIGKIQNMGSAQTRRYNLGRNSTFAVYIMDSLGTGRYEIWWAQGNTKRRVAGGRYRECNHPLQPYSYAVFTDCDNVPTLDPVQRGPTLKWKPGRHAGDTSRVKRPWNHENGPAWFTCKAGCCTADPQ